MALFDVLCPGTAPRLSAPPQIGFDWLCFSPRSPFLAQKRGKLGSFGAFCSFGSFGFPGFGRPGQCGRAGVNWVCFSSRPAFSSRNGRKLGSFCIIESIATARTPGAAFQIPLRPVIIWTCPAMAKPAFGLIVDLDPICLLEYKHPSSASRKISPIPPSGLLPPCLPGRMGKMFCDNPADK